MRTNAAEIFTALLTERPPAHAGTLLAILEGAAALNKNLRDRPLLDAVGDPWWPPELERLDAVIDEHLMILNHEACGLALIKNGRMAGIKGTYTPTDR